VQCLNSSRLPEKRQERMNVHKSIAGTDSVLELEMLRQRIRDLESREAQRKEVEDLFHNIAGSLHAGFYIVQNRKFLFINPYIQELTGYGEEALLGKDALDFVHPEDRDTVAGNVMTVMKNGRFNPFEYRILTRDGKIKWIMDSISLVMQDGKKAIFGNAMDITERKQASEEIHRTLIKLRKTIESTIQAMAVIVETRDPYTSGHQEQVSRIALAIGQEMGITDDRLQGLRLAALIHDIGKIYIPAEILSKPGELSEMEFEMMKMHPQVGFNILKTIESPYPLAQIVIQHHERLNGSGYPLGLSEKDILLEARILGVADVVDATACHRPYRAALGVDQAMGEILKNSGFLYDPVVVNTCIRLFKERGFPFE